MGEQDGMATGGMVEPGAAPLIGDGLCGIRVVVSEHLPIHPSPGADARRTVRHGLADWVAYIGEQAGPAPGGPTDVLMVGDGGRNGAALIVSRGRYEQIREVGT